MNEKNIEIYLNDILESIEKIVEYTSGINKDTFVKDTKIQDAVIRSLK